MKKISEMKEIEIVDAFNDKFINKYFPNLSYSYYKKNIINTTRRNQTLKVDQYEFLFIHGGNKKIVVSYIPLFNDVSTNIDIGLLKDSIFYKEILPILDTVNRLNTEYNLPDNFFLNMNPEPSYYKFFISNFLDNKFNDDISPEVSYFEFILSTNNDISISNLYIKKYIEKHHFENISSEINYYTYTNSFRKEKLTGNKIFSPKRKTFINKDYFKTIESFLYDNYFKTLYDIKRKSKKELEIVKMLRI